MPDKMKRFGLVGVIEGLVKIGVVRQVQLVGFARQVSGDLGGGADPMGSWRAGMDGGCASRRSEMGM